MMDKQCVCCVQFILCTTPVYFFSFNFSRFVQHIFAHTIPQQLLYYDKNTLYKKNSNTFRARFPIPQINNIIILLRINCVYIIINIFIVTRQLSYVELIINIITYYYYYCVYDGKRRVVWCFFSFVFVSFAPSSSASAAPAAVCTRYNIK